MKTQIKNLLISGSPILPSHYHEIVNYQIAEMLTNLIYRLIEEKLDGLEEVIEKTSSNAPISVLAQEIRNHFIGEKE
jgi:predicted PolB exonuclease-like 3'-5' exonuclease